MRYGPRFYVREEYSRYLYDTTYYFLRLDYIHDRLAKVRSRPNRPITKPTAAVLVPSFSAALCVHVRSLPQIIQEAAKDSVENWIPFNLQASAQSAVDAPYKYANKHAPQSNVVLRSIAELRPEFAGY